MTINLSVPELSELKPRIVVFGVGGAGGNAVNNMIRSRLEGAEFVVANTDAQAMSQSEADRRVQLGMSLTQGLGAGSRPEIGQRAAEEALDQIVEHLEGSNMAFITAGMGGGTGTGAAPVIAKAARELGILTVGVVTKPFQFEGTRRMRIAEEGIEALQQHVDTLIIIPNQNLFRIANEKTTFADAFKMADDVLHSGVKGITDLMVMPGLINLDFADVRTVMDEMGKAMMGTGEADGENRAIEAAERAISNPLLDDVSLKGARGVLINITGGMDLTLYELDEAANRIRDEVDPDANIIVGSTFEEQMEGRMRVSVVATGIEGESARQNAPQKLSMATARASAVRPDVSSAVPEEAPAVHGTAESGAPAPRAEKPVAAAPREEQPEPVQTSLLGEDGEDGDAVITRRPPTTGEKPFIAPEPMRAKPQNTPVLSPDPYREADVLNASGGEEQTPRRKGLGLFGRIKNRHAEKDVPPATKDESRMRTAEPAIKPAAPVSPAPAGKVQGEEDLLDIPTFLRRQAN